MLPVCGVFGEEVGGGRGGGWEGRLEGDGGGWGAELFERWL